MEQPVPRSSSSAIWYVVLTAVVIGLGILYFVMRPPVAENTAAGSQATTGETQAAPTEGNTTSDISADLSQIPDTSASLDSDAGVSAGDVQGL